MPIQQPILQLPKRYPLRPALEPGESLFGFLHRFAERNGLSRTTWLTGDLRVAPGTCYLSPDQIASFATMCGMPAATLAMRQTSAKRGTKSFILGTPLGRRHVRATLSRMCLHCVEERPYHCLPWNLLPVTHCPLHNALLIETCPTCQIPLGWHRAKLFKCMNDHDLRRAQGEYERGTVDAADLDGIKAIYEHCRFEHGSARVLGETPSSIRDLPEGEFIELLLWLSEIHTRAAGIDNSQECSAARSLSMGFSLTKRWPINLHQLIEPCITSGATFLGNGLSGWISKAVSALSPAKKAIVKPALAELARSYGRIRVFSDHARVPFVILFRRAPKC